MMSFQEKSTALMLGIIAVVYGWYFVVVGSQLRNTAVTEIGYKAVMLVTVVAVVVLAIVGHVLIVAVAPRDADASDERDRLIDLRGEGIGGYVLGTAAVAGLLLAVAELDFFWIANVLLAGLVLSEVASGVAKLVYYRRMV
jgi:hypothetical protein